MTTQYYHPGLRGVIAGETEICRLDGGVQYRGFCLHELAEGASFLEVAYLLLFDELPSEEQYADFLSIVSEEQSLPPIIEHMFERIPVHNCSLEVMRTGLSLLEHFDPQPNENLMQSGHAQTIRIMARMPLMISTWHRVRQGLPKLEPLPELGFIANTYYLMTGRVPSALYERALEVAFVVAAEHEFNPSSYVARIVGSTRSSQYAPILAALDTFIGSQHGGGDERPLDVLDAAGQAKSVEEWYESYQGNRYIPGFGHPVYTDYDPRASILEVECERLAQAAGRMDLEQLAESVERVVWQNRKIPPNVDWPLARLFTYLELDRDLFRPLFAAARIVGWSSHALEQCEASEVIRPRARYRGAVDCHFEPMRNRVD